jgi:hypothetical protein
LIRKTDADVPDEEIERIELSYRLFHMLPDDIDLRQLIIDVLSEQVVGFYDPASDTLYVVDGSLQAQVGLTVSHELVHALQGQHIPAESLLAARGDNDRRLAAQAVLEGQGMVASLAVMLPDQDFRDIPNFWRLAREATGRQLGNMPVLASAPRILRDLMVFPYLDGGDFAAWFAGQYPNRQPFGEYMPVSTEQILNPGRYVQRDVPVEMDFDGDPLYQDGLGQFEMRVLFEELTGSKETATASVRDWDGDRYAVFEVGNEHALVWWTVWDNPEAAQRFLGVLEREWPKKLGVGRDYAISPSEMNGQAAVLLVDAPIGWEGFRETPTVTVRR